MKVGRNRGFTFNMGNYETYKTDVYIELEPSDLDSWDEGSSLEAKVNVLNEAATEHINRLIEEEVADASELTSAQKSILKPRVTKTKSK